MKTIVSESRKLPLNPQTFRETVSNILKVKPEPKSRKKRNK